MFCVLIARIFAIVLFVSIEFIVLSVLIVTFVSIVLVVLIVLCVDVSPCVFNVHFAPFIIY